MVEGADGLAAQKASAPTETHADGGSAEGVLVIGYGNTLRRDDGVGIKVAQAIGELNLPNVKVMVRHQLVPELAEAISTARIIIFVDADAKATGPLEPRRIQAHDTTQVLAHAADPSALLALAKQVFSRTPQAWALSIPVADLGFGEGLSAKAEESMRVAIDQIRSLAT